MKTTTLLSKKPGFVIIFSISIILVVFNIIRIFNIPLTYDEAGDYVDTNSYADFIRMTAPSANIHILNSLLRKFFVDNFANNFFFIRLDSLLAQIIFLISGYKLCRLLYQSAIWMVCTFLLLNLYLLLFDFWCVGRGYGLAIAFMTASIFQLLNYYKNDRKWSIHLCFLFAILSVYSNFALLDYYVGMAGFMLLKPVFFRNNLKAFSRKELPVLSVYTLILYLLVATPIKKLIATGQFYYGGDKDIISDTVYSLIGNNLFISVDDPKHFTEVSMITWFVIVFSIVPSLYWIAAYVRNRKKPSEKIFTGVLLWVLFVVPVLSSMLMHIFFKTKYLLDRTALFLMVLFALQFCYWVYFATQKKAVVGKSFLLILTIFVGYNFATRLNFFSTKIWWFDKFNLAVLKKISRESQNGEAKKSLAIYWLFEPSIKYYVEGHYNKYILSVTSLHDEVIKDTSFDYYYTFGDKASHISDRYVLDTSFEGGNFVLYKKR